MAQQPQQSQQQEPQRAMKEFEVVPKHWPVKYGEKPILDKLKAPDAFTAIRMSYNRGKWHPNFSFEVEARSL